MNARELLARAREREELSFVELLLVEILDQVLETKEKVQNMATPIDDIKAAVAAEVTVTQSAITLLQQLKTQLDAAVAAGDLSQVEALAQQLGSNTSALAAAVSANTPAVAAPTPDPTPAPAPVSPPAS